MTSDDEQPHEQEERPGFGADETHEAEESSGTTESYEEDEPYETGEPFRLSPAEIDEILGTFEPPPPGSPTPPPPDFVLPGRGVEAAPDAGPDEEAGGPAGRQSDSATAASSGLGTPSGLGFPAPRTDGPALSPPLPPPANEYPLQRPQWGGSAPPGPSFPRTGYPNVIGDPGMAPPGPQFSPGPSPAPPPAPMPGPYQSRASFDPVQPATPSLPFEDGSHLPRYGTPPGPRFDSVRAQSGPSHGGDTLGPAPDLRVPLIRRLLRFLGLGR